MAKINLFWKCCRRLKTILWRVRLNNSNFSIICNNCVGAMVLHDLKIRFNSPTVNLWMKPSEYISFLEYLYSREPITDVEDCRMVSNEPYPDINYPVGILNNKIHLFFLHYRNFAEAKAKWLIRASRVNYDNLYIILIERDGCTYKDLVKFDKLPFKHKVAIVHRCYPEIKCAWVYPGVDQCKEVPDLIEPISIWGGRKYDLFDWISWINK